MVDKCKFYGILLISASCRFCASFGINCMFVYLPEMTLYFGYKEVEKGYFAGMLAAAYPIGSFLTCYPLSLLSDRLGHLSMIRALLLSTTLICIISAFSPDLISTFIFRALMGITSAVVPISKAMVYTHTDVDSVSTAMAVSGFASGLGFSAAAAVGGFLENPRHKYPKVFNEATVFSMFPYLLPNLIGAVFNGIAFLFTMSVHEKYGCVRDYGVDFRGKEADVINGKQSSVNTACNDTTTESEIMNSEQCNVDIGYNDSDIRSSSANDTGNDDDIKEYQIKRTKPEDMISIHTEQSIEGASYHKSLVRKWSVTKATINKHKTKRETESKVAEYERESKLNKQLVNSPESNLINSYQTIKETEFTNYSPLTSQSNNLSKYNVKSNDEQSQIHTQFHTTKTYNSMSERKEKITSNSTENIDKTDSTSHENFDTKRKYEHIENATKNSSGIDKTMTMRNFFMNFFLRCRHNNYKELDNDIDNDIDTQSFRLKTYLQQTTLVKIVTNSTIIKPVILDSLLSLTYTGFIKVFAIWASTIPFLGGLGYTTNQIGVVYMIITIPTSILQFFTFPYIAKSIGATRCYIVSTMVCMLFVSMQPLCRLIDSNIKQWIAVILCQLVVNIANISGHTTMGYIINKSGGEMTETGAVNGFARFVTSVGQALGPVIAGSVFAFTVTAEYGAPFDVNLSFVVLGFVGFVGAIGAYSLHPSVESHIES